MNHHVLQDGVRHPEEAHLAQGKSPAGRHPGLCSWELPLKVSLLLTSLHHLRKHGPQVGRQSYWVTLQERGPTPKWLTMR